MKIALVHDYLIQYGGAERVLESFCELFPNAPIYTLVYNKKTLGKAFQDKEIRTSFLQKIPFSRSEHHEANTICLIMMLYFRIQLVMLRE